MEIWNRKECQTVSVSTADFTMTMSSISNLELATHRPPSCSSKRFRSLPQPRRQDPPQHQEPSEYEVNIRCDRPDISSPMGGSSGENAWRTRQGYYVPEFNRGRDISTSGGQRDTHALVRSRTSSQRRNSHSGNELGNDAGSSCIWAVWQVLATVQRLRLSA
ncbi:hypothetical protein BJ508DRAFT_169300 [Ascobolus immersus RN42]|uniref:Uncharacterized protein n=1 Tax=Ascobolus immersus RN42 TaxID=1160509 RepID=A0A3N4I030_ASCIM|nr:hypothetical protein BJ508DRAFT_169300 [Ascobolus immersus RN42]